MVSDGQLLGLERGRKSLGDHIYERLREQIVYLQLEPGQMMYENEAAERLQVSRTPVREAFHLLAKEQLIEIQPQRGTKISYISMRKVKEVRFIREHLESGAFRLAARMWNDSIAQAYEEKFEQLLEKQQRAVEQRNAADLLKLDEDFHKLIMAITENYTLLQVIDHMRSHINRVRFLALTQFNQMERIVAEHAEILSSLKSGDEKTLADQLEQHFRKLDRELPELREVYPQYFVD